MSRLWRRARMTSPLARDRVFAAVLFVAAEIEVLSVGHGDAPLRALMLAAAGYTLPFAFRREHTLAAVCIVIASVVAESALLTDATRYFVPFLSAMLFSYSAGAYLEGRRAYARAGDHGRRHPHGDDPVAERRSLGDYIFPTSFGAIGWLAGARACAPARG